MQPSSRRRRWVLIETGGNQRYIFGSSRLRHVVGASQLVHEVGTGWVPEAVDACGLSDDTVVMTASGKALLLVDSREAGRAVVREVTRRALREAPGLRVTGVVGPEFDPQAPMAHERARAETYGQMPLVRAARPSLQNRDRVFPWHELCRYSGQPAACREPYGGDEPPVPTAAAMLARSQARNRAYERLRATLGDDLAGVLPAHLEELQHSGWIAVVHADGNGVGGLFRRFLEHIAKADDVPEAEVPLATHARYQGDVARELDEATWDAVRDAIRTLYDRSRGTSADLPAPDDRLLPVVVGGDDVTVVCDAALAVPFAEAFAVAFERRTAGKPTLRKIVEAATGHTGLTASAGIAVVKLHHPFATAYALAEELTVSAKRLKPDGRALGAFDVHIAHVSTLRPLELLRQYVDADGAPVARYAGPYLVADRAEDLPEPVRDRWVGLLHEVLGWLGPDGWLSAAQAHALRQAADRSLAEYQRQLDLLLGRVDLTPELRERARALLSVQHPSPGKTTGGVERMPAFLRLFDAMHLRGLRLDGPPRLAEAAVTAAAGTGSTVGGAVA